MIYRINIGVRMFESALPVYVIKSDNGRSQIMTSQGDFEAVQPGAYNVPSFVLSDDDAQILANQLWEAGVRPAQAGRSVGQIEAQGAHLSDMRAIAFAKLGIERP